MSLKTLAVAILPLLDRVAHAAPLRHGSSLQLVPTGVTVRPDVPVQTSDALDLVVKPTTTTPAKPKRLPANLAATLEADKSSIAALEAAIKTAPPSAVPTLREAELGVMSDEAAALQSTGAAGAGECHPQKPAGKRSLFIAAHEDDDILFMNPDLASGMADPNRDMLTVFVTAGNAGLGPRYWHDREDGAMAAHASMLKQPNQWEQVNTTVNDVVLTRFVNSAAPRASLLFLRLPDGGQKGAGYRVNGNESLRRLWDGNVTVMNAVDGAWKPNKKDVIDMLSGIIKYYQPSDIHTLDCTKHCTYDHSDHHYSAVFAAAAYKASSTDVPVTLYRGYNIASEPNNLVAAVASEKSTIFSEYLAHDSRLCAHGNCKTYPPYVPYFDRRYYAAQSLNRAQYANAC